MSTKAVLFDLFETLITEFAEGKRIAVREDRYEELLGLSAADFKREWNSRFEQRMNGGFSGFHEVLKDILQARNLPYAEHNVQLLYESRIQEKLIPYRHINREIVSMLELLKNNHIKLGLISNCTEEEVRGWSESELLPYFDTVLFSYELKLAKPDIRIYQEACRRLSVSPEEVAFVGDGGSSELDGAERAGLRVCHAQWFNSFVDSKFMKYRSPGEFIQSLKVC